MGHFEEVAALPFDTTTTNTAVYYWRRSGTCVLLEQKLYKDLVCLVCRHHVMEHMGAGSEPKVSLFKGFKFQ